MDLADDFNELQINSGISSGTETKTYSVQQLDGTYETIVLQFSWWEDQNSNLKYQSEYQEL